MSPTAAICSPHEGCEGHQTRTRQRLHSRSHRRDTPAPPRLQALQRSDRLGATKPVTAPRSSVLAGSGGCNRASRPGEISPGIRDGGRINPATGVGSIDEGGPKVKSFNF